ncbi:MAG: ABC transporter substrate-binding protein [Burkholderiales bacterium]|nr:ABC transporter substrate-binding protein [Burkholderiales bacterium]
MKHCITRARQILGSAAIALSVALPATAQETIKVGLLFTYSGPSGISGQLSDNAIKLFQQKHGTTAGGKKIEFVKRDTTGPNPEVAKRLAQELIVREKVQILIGPDFTPNVLAVAPLVTEARVPAIITGAATGGIVGEKSPYYIRTFYSVPQVVRPMAQWAHQNGVKRPYVVVADFGPGHDTEATFAKSFGDLGGQVAGSSRVSLRNPEFSSYMQRIKDAKPDAVFVFLPIGELVPQFLKAYSDSGLKNTNIKLLGTGDMSDESVVDAAGDAALGLITAGAYSHVHESTLNRRFVAEYTESFGKTPRHTSGTIAVWDALRLIYDGVAAQGSATFDPDKFMAFARGRTFESPRGPVTIDKATGDITQNIYLRRVEKQLGMLQNVEFATIPNVPAK